MVGTVLMDAITCCGVCECDDGHCRCTQVLIDAVVHAVNEDYDEMAGDFIKLGFLTPGACGGCAVPPHHLPLSCLQVYTTMASSQPIYCCCKHHY